MNAALNANTEKWDFLEHASILKLATFWPSQTRSDYYLRSEPRE